VTNKEAARDAHIKFLSSEVGPVLDAMDRDRRTAHAVIDTEASYEALARLCTGW
jgi:hypothetical protein